MLRFFSKQLQGTESSTTCKWGWLVNMLISNYSRVRLSSGLLMDPITPINQGKVACNSGSLTIFNLLSQRISQCPCPFNGCPQTLQSPSLLLRAPTRKSGLRFFQAAVYAPPVRSLLLSLDLVVKPLQFWSLLHLSSLYIQCTTENTHLSTCRVRQLP